MSRGVIESVWMILSKCSRARLPIMKASMGEESMAASRSWCLDDRSISNNVNSMPKFGTALFSAFEPKSFASNDIHANMWPLMVCQSLSIYDKAYCCSFHYFLHHRLHTPDGCQKIICPIDWFYTPMPKRSIYQRVASLARANTHQLTGKWPNQFNEWEDQRNDRKTMAIWEKINKRGHST